jgi:hypothetical protein
MQKVISRDAEIPTCITHLFVDASHGDVTVYLPPAKDWLIDLASRDLVIKRIDTNGDAKVIIVSKYSKIDGVERYEVCSPLASIVLHPFNEVTWYVV